MSRADLLKTFADQPEPIQRLLEAAGFASFRMTQECGNTHANQTRNAIASIRTFLVWAEAAGFALPTDLVREVEEIYSGLPQ